MIMKPLETTTRESDGSRAAGVLDLHGFGGSDGFWGVG